MKFTSIFLSLIFCLFTTAFTPVQTSDKKEVNDLSGLILSSNSGQPIPGATIIIQELDRGTAADSDGLFQFTSIPSGSYTLNIRAVGYQNTSTNIQVPVEKPLTIELKPTVINIDDVIVTSSPIGKNIQYQPAQSFNAETLQRKAAPSLGEILDGSPGVTTRSFGSAPARPVIRGFDGDRVLVLQNGERMGDLSATAVDHAVGLDPLAMERVEVVRGPASLLYGSSAIGGVVNMFTSDMPREWVPGASGSAATHLSTMNDMGAGLIRVQQGNEHFAATGRMIYRDGGDLRTPEGRLPDTSLENLTYGAGVGYRSGNLETGISLSGMDYTYGLPEAIDSSDESIEIRLDRINLQSVSTLKIDRFIELAELRIHYSDYFHEEIEIERFGANQLEEGVEITFDQQTVSSSLLLRHRPAGSFEGAFGFSFNYSELKVGGGEALTPNANGYFFAGYLYEEFKLSDIVSFKSGLRAEWKETFVKANQLFPDASQFEDRDDLILSGAFGVNISPNRNWTVGLQLARAFRTPTIEELYSFAPHAAAGSFDIGDPTLDNEISIGTDLFTKFQSDRFQGELSVFINSIDNFVDFTPTGEIHNPTGLPFFEYGSKDALLWGFEANAEAAITPYLRAGTGVDFVRGQERTGDKNDLTFMPPVRTKLNLIYDNGKMWAGPRVSLISRQNRVAPNEDPTDGYVLLGADAGYRISSGITLSMRLDNLMNERYRDHLSRVENRNAPMPGRNFNIMVRWEF